jgi:hypothetical protein
VKKHFINGTPLAGDSGMVFSSVLLENSTTPAGEHIADGSFYYGIMNTFQFPLQSNSEINPLFELNEKINYESIFFAWKRKRPLGQQNN